MREIERISGLPGERHGELGGDGLAHNHGAGVSEMRHASGVGAGPVSGVDGRSVLRRHVGRVDDVLYGDWNAVERTARFLSVARAGVREHLLRIDVRPRLDGFLTRSDSCKTIFGELDGSKLAGGNECGGFDGGKAVRVVHAASGLVRNSGCGAMVAKQAHVMGRAHTREEAHMIEVRRLGSQIGAEITGVDVKSMDEATFGVIYKAWLDYNVVAVRDQSLALDDFVHYSRRFGRVEPHPSKSTRHPECPEITLLGVNKFRPDGELDMAIYRRGAEGWHTDGAYDDQPFKATQLYALAIPSRGGDTLFASMYAAYDALPDTLKRRVDGLVGAYVYGGRRKRNDLLNPEDRDKKPALHPIVRTHPEA